MAKDVIVVVQRDALPTENAVSYTQLTLPTN